MTNDETGPQQSEHSDESKILGGSNFSANRCVCFVETVNFNPNEMDIYAPSRGKTQLEEVTSMF